MRGTKEQSWCPVCGALVPPSALVAGSPKQHRCKEKFLRDRDRAHKANDGRAVQINHCLEQRLKDGFQALQESEE